MNQFSWWWEEDEPEEKPVEHDKNEPISFRFKHGFGDACNMAHMIPLWTRRGWAVEVETAPEFAPLFLAAGAKIVDKARTEHVFGYPAPTAYPHPPKQLSRNNPTEWNKIAWNLDKSKVMPDIGTRAELWPEMLDVKLSVRPYLTDRGRAEIDEFVATIGGPLVLLHSRGRVSQSHVRPFSPELELETYREIIDRTDATILQLDFDGNVSRFANRRFRHLTDDFRKLTLPEVVYLMEWASLYIGCDSGPAHLTRLTDTPSLVVWFGNHPALHSLPRERTLNIADIRHKDLNSARRHVNHVLELDTITGAGIAEQARLLLDGFTPRELVRQGLLGRLKKAGTDRNKSFTLAFQHLRGKTCPVMVETGCQRTWDDYGAGMSTYLFGHFFDQFGGNLVSVDNNETNVKKCAEWCESFPVQVVHSDSVKYLDEYAGRPIDVLYLDSMDCSVPGHEAHGLRELQAGIGKLAADGIILVDDTPWKAGKWTGKGALVVPYLLSSGWKVKYAGYQVLLERCS